MCVGLCVFGGVVGWVGVIDLFEGHRDGSYIKQMKIPGCNLKFDFHGNGL